MTNFGRNIAGIKLLLGDVVVFEKCQLVTAVKFINKSSLFMLLLGIIRWLDLKPISEKKDEHIFVAILPNRVLVTIFFNNFIISLSAPLHHKQFYHSPSLTHSLFVAMQEQEFQKYPAIKLQGLLPF